MIENHDWRRTLNEGMQMAVENARKGSDLGGVHVMWELLCEAAKVSQLAYSAPPRTGYPSKSVMPDSVDDVTQWQLISAYIRGELDEMPAEESKPPMPSAEQVSRSDVILFLWHNHALTRLGDRSRMKKAVYLKACGVADRKVRAVTGMTRQAIHKAKQEAMQDMWDIISDG